MKTFKTFFEEGIALKRNGVPFGHIYNRDKDGNIIINRDKDGNIINFKLNKDVEGYKRERDDAVETKTSTGHGNITDNIRYDLNKQINAVMRYYGFRLKSEFKSLPTDGSLVYRGHKDPDPFSKSEDAKTRGDKVYFSSNSNYAHSIYSVGYNPNSKQVGQAGFSSIQSKFQSPDYNAKWGIGFFSVATPKNADKILWYHNFGFEDGSEGFTRLQRGIENVYGLECVEPRESFLKIRTFLTYTEYIETYMISFDRLKQVQPDLYNQVKDSYVIKSIKEPRLYQ